MRILVTGPECTGKSTLSQQLSDILKIPLLHEYARTYLEEHGPDYNKEDLQKITQEHVALVNNFPSDQPLILDTYIYNLQVWNIFKYGNEDPFITKQLESSHHLDLVFLLAPDIPWTQDGLRENPKPEDAQALFNLFIDQLNKYNQPYHLISGLGPSRLQNALYYLPTT